MTDATAGTDGVGAITLDPGDPLGYKRPAALQDRFTTAAAALRQSDHWTNTDGSTPPGPPELRCDLALEGGGVKGIGLVGAVLVLSEAGYKIQRVAGTSAGAIAASLIAALVDHGDEMSTLKDELDNLDFRNFMPEGALRRFVGFVGRAPGTYLADTVILATRMGLYPGTYLKTWLEPILGGLGIETFADLKITPQQDEGMSLPPERRYRLVVHTSDITRGQLVRLPWDYDYYGVNRDEQSVVDAVRASMSIPIFFRPVQFTSNMASVPTPRPGGDTTTERYAPGTVTWVDGGMLENFPIDAFDRIDGGRPRWPTIGIKLSQLQDSYPATTACSTTVGVARRCIGTMMSEWDRYNIEETTAARTIFVDNAGITATQFDLTQNDQDTLFLNGVTAATQFVIEMADYGHVPRRGGDSETLVAYRQQLTMAAGRH
jgi:NTE family protein